MENARAIQKEQAPRDAVCARCGAEAQWMFADTERTRVEVICPDCGKYEMPRPEFDHVESEIVEPEER